MNYPDELKQIARRHKKAFVTVVDPISGNDCRNCGGVGRLSLFCAMEGPYQSPSNPYRTIPALNDAKQPIEHSLSNHFDDELGLWWSGTVYTFECPDCNGVGKKRLVNYKDYQTQKMLQKSFGLVHPHTGEILE